MNPAPKTYYLTCGHSVNVSYSPFLGEYIYCDECHTSREVTMGTMCRHCGQAIYLEEGVWRDKHERNACQQLHSPQYLGE